jgi:expansin (peptidoglycan-binding protein)
VTWTCTASAGSSCPASGSGNINHTVNILFGGTATYTATGTIAASASAAPLTRSAVGM